MVRRAEIVVPFNYDETWIGGAYYITNLISALNLLPAWRRPRIWMLSHGESSFDFIRKRTGYPNLEWLGPHLHPLLDPGVLWKKREKRWGVPDFFRRRATFDLVFPYPIDPQWHQTACWIPDFQDLRLPNFFTLEEREMRAAQHRQWFTDYQHLVLSSKAARADFEHFYPEARVHIHVMPFAVFPNADRPDLDFAELRARYVLPERYFYSPNQFWIHKNHQVVIRALALLKQQGIRLELVFSGKEHDARAPDYSDRMRALVSELSVADQVKFLGFIPRDEQMEVFKHAACIVQPSLFEGWSTVIEDAKSLSQYVVASDIAPHREQLTVNAEFFDPNDPAALAAILASYATQDPVRAPVDYSAQRRAFAERFIAIVKTVRRERAVLARRQGDVPCPDLASTPAKN